MVAKSTGIVKALLAERTFVLEQTLVKVNVVLKLIFSCKGPSTLRTNKRPDL